DRSLEELPVSLRLALLLALLFAALVAHLTSLDTSGVRLSLGAGWAYDVPLMALLLGALSAGRRLMLDGAAEPFQKLEVKAPDRGAIHAYVPAILERHVRREALEEYRWPLRVREAFGSPRRGVACGATRSSWFDRCPSCRRWNTARP